MKSVQQWKSSSWNPWRELVAFPNNLDQMFDRLVPTSSNDMTRALLTPECDIEESDASYIMTFEVPGIPKEDIKIEAFGNQVRVSGEKKYSHDEKKATRHVTERYYGRFERSFALPSKVDIDKVDAQYKDGVLKITLPKASGAVSRQIKVSDSTETSSNKKA